MDTKLFKLLSEKTNQEILLKLSEKPYSTTELLKELKGITYRESIFKALEKLRKANLIERRYNPKLKGYKYKTKFKKIEIDSKLKIKLT